MTLFNSLLSTVALIPKGLLFAFFVLLFFFSWELIIKPRRVSWQTRKNSYRNNFLILFFNNFLMFLIAGTSLYWLAINSSWGLLQGIDNAFLQFFIFLLVFDLLMYLWHILNHKIPFLWRFHSCHHSDHDLNSTTGFRFHWGELFLSLFYKSTFILLLGPAGSFILFYEAAIFCFAVFHHSDIKIPLENQLKYLVVVPSHHATHHSIVRENHDSNYGVIFSFWDKLFHTYNQFQPKKFGLIGEGEKNFFTFITFAFKNKSNLIFLFLFFFMLLFIHQYLRHSF